MKIYSMKKFATCFLLLCFVSYVSAKDIYLSPTGDDGNDGSSQAKAVATLTKAIKLIPVNGTGYVIKVSGMIDISKEISGDAGVVVNKKIDFSIEGDTEIASGLDGKDITRLINFQNAPGNATLRNLTFKNGKSTDGGAIRIVDSGTVNIVKCAFRNNTASKSGGAIYTGNTNGLTIDQSILSDNKSTTQGGAITIFGSSSGEKAVVIKNTLISGNQSVSNGGGGIFINDGTEDRSIQVLIVNSTIYQNQSKTYGGALYVSGGQGGSTVKLVNATITENITDGNGGHGPGMCFRDNNAMIKTIYNCILENNAAPGSSQVGDITSNQAFNASQEDFILRNSYVGAFTGSGNYTDDPSYKNTVKYGTSKAAGLATPSADYIAKQNSIPLDFDSEALVKGDARYLKDLSINTDQPGNIRSFKNDACAAGAVEVPAKLVIVDPDNYNYQHFIIYGQSLSVGYESYYSLSTTNVPGNYMIGDQVWLNFGNQVLDKLNPLVSAKAITAVMGECPITGAVNHIRIRQEREMPSIKNRFIATSVGMGGKTIAQLSKGSEGNLYQNYESALKSSNRLVLKSGSKISCPAVVWMQGENDYIGNPATPKSEYKSDLVRLKDDMLADAVEVYGQTEKPKFYTYQAGAQYTRGKELGIGMAQLELSNEAEDVICVGPVYPVTDVGGHIDANGSRWFGEMIGKAYCKTKMSGEDFKPLQPQELSRDASDPKKVIITFLVPKLPLVFDTYTLKAVKDYGFEVYNDNTRQTISKIEINHNSVILTCSANLTGKIEVVYAGVNAANTDGVGNGRGHGNLRDSDDYTATSNYINPTLKDGNGNYLYPHFHKEEDYSYLPASGEPKDSNGNVIYDKPYPLYNFSVAFYYVIPAGEQSVKVPGVSGNSSKIAMVKTGNKIEINQTEKKLRLKSSKTENVHVSLLGISGMIVKNWGQEILIADTTKKYDLSLIPSGIYIVQVQAREGLQTCKILL